MVRAALVALGLTACTGAEEPAAPLTPADWMSDVFAVHDDVTLGRILIPGAFNSTSYTVDAEHGISPHAPEMVINLFGTGDGENPLRDRIVEWAKTQDRTIAQQLEDGIRSLDFVLTVKDGALFTWHSIYGVPAGDVLDELVAFAVAHPAEVIILQFGLDADPADWGLFADALAAPRSGGASVCDLLYDSPDNAVHATIADVRASGRNLVWGAEGELRTFLEGSCTMSNLPVDLRWSLTTRPDGVAEALTATVDSRDPERMLINDFAFSLDGSETGEEQAGYVIQYGSVKEATLALGFAGDFPERMIAQFDVNENMNIFAGAMYEDTTLIEAVIQRNRERVGP